MSNLTLEDIAKKAGVSRSTVSRVVNNHKHISDTVRSRVLQVINETGYRPNVAARTLASQRTRMIGLVLPQTVGVFFTDPFFPHLVKGISQACNRFDYSLALFLVSSNDDENKIFTRVTNQSLLDGVLVQSGHHGDQRIIGQLIDARMPQVVIGRPFRYDNVSFVDVDNVSSVYDAISYMIRLGYKRIATITGPMGSTAAIDRKEGYLHALSDHGIEVDQTLITEGDFTEQSGYFGMQSLLSQQPEAVFAASDTMAIGAIRAIQERGLNVPEDIAVIGFDDVPITAVQDIKLTTINQPVYELGAKAVEMLIDLIENGIEPPRHTILNPQMVVRSTCGTSTG